MTDANLFIVFAFQHALGWAIVTYFQKLHDGIFGKKKKKHYSL